MSEETGPEAALRSMTQHPGVKGYVVLDKEGIPIKFDGVTQKEATDYAALVSEFNIKVKQFLGEDYVKVMIPPPDNELVSVRLRTKNNELIITPDSNFCLIVIHDPHCHDAGAAAASAGASSAAAAAAASSSSAAPSGHAGPDEVKS